MTPQERQLVDALFDRLATLEDTRRDPQADSAIRDGLRRAPNAVYALVQTVLIQDEALKRADARIRELEGGAEPSQQEGSFLDDMRGALFGERNARGSVPSVRPGEAMPSPAQPAQGGGGSFLGTAAAAAAGVIGGALLLDSIRSMTGSRQGALGQQAGNGATADTPWGGNGDLAREAGVNDIGRDANAGSERQGLFDTARNDASDDDDDFDDDGDFDFGDTDFG